MKLGRPIKYGAPACVVINLRLPGYKKLGWRKKARAAGLTLSAWMVRNLDAVR
jgi:hypothetical protein